MTEELKPEEIQAKVQEELDKVKLELDQERVAKFNVVEELKETRKKHQDEIKALKPEPPKDQS